jgi:hypothetical protein
VFELEKEMGDVVTRRKVKLCRHTVERSGAKEQPQQANRLRELRLPSHDSSSIFCAIMLYFVDPFAFSSLHSHSGNYGTLHHGKLHYVDFLTR